MIESKLDLRFTAKILLGMLLGMVLGLLFKYVLVVPHIIELFVRDVFQPLGAIFLRLIRMLVVPIVFVSLVCGAANLGGFRQLGRIGGKSLALYLLTTAVAICLALLVAVTLDVGGGFKTAGLLNITIPSAISLKAVFINIFPLNPFTALVDGNMLQIIVFSILLGITLSVCGDAGERVANGFRSFEKVMIKMILLVMQLAPYGVFCLLTVLFYQFGWPGVVKVLGYFMVVVLVLMIQLVVIYSLMLRVIGRINPIVFFRKMYTAMLFAFSVSSSSASIPVVLNAVKSRLGVGERVAAFVIPTGATINMDGTAIMQGVATVFIANVFHVHLGLAQYLMVILMATLSSIGTAGVPSAGLITLALVLEQVGLPVKGIALIFGVDRLLDMMRTAVNVAGDATIACLVAKSEKVLNREILNNDC